jgi:ligand-binding sensor domain-containing protein
MSNAMLIRLWLVALLSFGISSLYASDSALPVFHFGHISAQDGLPTDEVRQIYQDKDGYIWIATNSGLCQYDGYQIKTYKSNLHTPGLLSNNTICCVAEDNHHNLWIAAYDGVNVLNKTTGHIRKIDSKELRRSIVDRLLVTATDRIFIGTEAGVFEYFSEKDSCVAFKPDVLKGSVKAMIEDSNHNLWIGTWSDGFYRYDPEVDKVFAYPVLNGRNSAYDIFEDSKQRIWIGSWGYGLFLLENPYEPERLSWKQYKHDANNPNSLCDDIIYDIDEDLNTGTLWIGTRNGLSILYNEAASLFQSYRPDNSEISVYHNEISSVFLGLTLFAIPLVVKEEWASIKGKAGCLVFTLIGMALVFCISYFNPTNGNGISVNFEHMTAGLSVFCCHDRHYSDGTSGNFRFHTAFDLRTLCAGDQRDPRIYAFKPVLSSGTCYFRTGSSYGYCQHYQDH